MRQLTGLDAQFLALESGRQTGHVGALAVLDPSTRPNGRMELADLHNMISERLPLLPPFRWRLKELPLGLDYPYWVDDPDFDLEYHVREIALAPPATDDKLAEQVARIFARPLDRARPLWEAYLIHGLQDGNVALLTKIHHSAVDGISGAEILTVLLDLTPEGRELPQRQCRRPTREPGELEMLARGLFGAPRYVGRVLKALPSTVANLEDTPILSDLPGAKIVGRTTETVTRRLRRRPSRVLQRTDLSPPRTTFNGRVSPHRRFAFGQLSLQDVKTVKSAYGYTVNDVVVALCAGAVRRWLIAHDELPDGPLVTQVPVSVRSDDERGTFGNRIGMLSVPLYTNEADPVERLRLTHEAMQMAKERAQGAAGRPAARRDPVHPAGRVRAGLADLVLARGHPSPGVEPRRLERARAAVPAVLRGRADGRALSGLGDHRRHGPEHHRDELLRSPRLRDRRRPRADARRVEADRMAARGAR